MSAHAHTLHADGPSLNRTAALATLHCLTGCAIGEVLGLVVGTALGLSNPATIALAVTLAFVFGYSLTMVPLLRAGLAVGAALPLAFAADSFSIAVMELVDNGVMLAVPGAMDAPLTNPLFWGALGFALAVAYVVAFPVNRHLIARGRGHAVVHEHHHGHAGAAAAGPPSSSRRLVAVGLAAMAATIAIATGGAILVEGHATSDEPHAEPPPAGEHADPHGPAGAAAVADGLALASGRYLLDVRETELAAGVPAAFTFSVLDEEGGPVRRFDEHGGVAMHLIVVGRDLAGLQHLHPEQQADGSWRIELTLPAAGVYRAFVDFERGGEQTVLGTDLFAGGDYAPARLPVAAGVTEVDGYRVELDAHADAGEETTLAYRVTRDGAPVDVEPYLGAAGHLVALREGDLGYLHVHPLAERAGEIRFAAAFPTPGNYRLFLQFRDAGRVHTAPLTLTVGRGH